MSESNGGVIPEANGKKVTQADLYKALYELSGQIGERFNRVEDLIIDNSKSILMTAGLLDAHRADGHPFTQAAEIAQAKLKLDTKKAALAAVVVAFLGTIGAAAIKLIEYFWV